MSADAPAEFLDRRAILRSHHHCRGGVDDAHILDIEVPGTSIAHHERPRHADAVAVKFIRVNDGQRLLGPFVAPKLIGRQQPSRGCNDNLNNTPLDHIHGPGRGNGIAQSYTLNNVPNGT